MDLVGATAVRVLLLYARGEISHHRMTEGQFFAFLYAMFNTYMPVKRIGYVYQQLQAVLGASAQVFAYLDREEEKHDQPGAVPLAPLSDETDFANVCRTHE